MADQIETSAEKFARRAGEHAAWHGSPASSNPHGTDDQLHQAWARGHRSHLAAILRFKGQVRK